MPFNLPPLSGGPIVGPIVRGGETEEQRRRRLAAEAAARGESVGQQASEATTRNQVNRESVMAGPPPAPKPERITPVQRTIDSLRSDNPDTQGAKTIADTAKKVAKMYSQISGGRVLLPDVHLALTMSGMPLAQIEMLLRSDPEAIAQIVEPEGFDGSEASGEVRSGEPVLAPGSVFGKPEGNKGETYRSPKGGTASRRDWNVARQPQSIEEYRWQQNAIKNRSEAAGTLNIPIAGVTTFAPDVNKESIVNMDSPDYNRIMHGFTVPGVSLQPNDPKDNFKPTPERSPSGAPRKHKGIPSLVASTNTAWVNMVRGLLEDKGIKIDSGGMAPDIETLRRLGEAAGVKLPPPPESPQNPASPTQGAFAGAVAQGEVGTAKREDTTKNAAVDKPPTDWVGNPTAVETEPPPEAQQTLNTARQWIAEHPTSPLPDWVRGELDNVYPLYPSYIGEAMAAATPESQGIEQAKNQEGEVTTWGGGKISGEVASIIPTAEGQILSEHITGELPKQAADLNANIKTTSDKITWLEEQKRKALSGDYVTDENTIPKIEADLANQRDVLGRLQSASDIAGAEIDAWNNDPVRKYKQMIDEGIKETYLAGEAMNQAFGEGGYGKKMVTESDAAELEAKGVVVTRFNEPFADPGGMGAMLLGGDTTGSGPSGSYVGYVDDYGDDDNIAYRRENYERWQRKGQVMFATNTIAVHAGLEELKKTYDPNDPNSRSIRVEAFQKRLNSFVGADGNARYPVLVTGRLDDPYTEMAALQLSYDRAAILVALPMIDADTQQKAKEFIDSYQKTLAARVANLDPNLSQAVGAPSPELSENNPNLKEYDRAQLENMRKAWADKLAPITTSGTVGDLPLVTAWNVEDEDRFNVLPEVRAVRNSDFAYIEGDESPADEMLFHRALSLRNPNVPESEFSVWWLNNVGEDSMPKEYREQYSKGRMSEIMQGAQNFIGDVYGEASYRAGQAKDILLEENPLNVRESVYAANAIFDTIASFKISEGNNTLGDVAGLIEDETIDKTVDMAKGGGELLVKGVTGLVENFVEIPALGTYLFGVAAAEGFTDKMKSVAHDPFNGYTYSDQNLGSLRDWAVSWKEAMDQAHDIVNDESGEHPTSAIPFIMEQYGYPVEKEPVLPFMADLVFETKGLKLLGTPGKIAKTKWGVPAAEKIGMQLPWVKPTLERVVSVPLVADESGALARKVDDIYDLMPGLSKLEYAPLANNLRYVDDVSEVGVEEATRQAKEIISDYIKKNPSAGDAVTLFEDSLTGTVINQTKMMLEDSRIGGKIAPVLRSTLRPTPTTQNDELHHIRDPFDSIEQSAMSAGFSRKEIAGYKAQLHETLGVTGTPQIAVEEVMNNMLDDIYARAGKKWYPGLNPKAATAAVKNDLAQFTGKQPQVRHLPSQEGFPVSMVGGKKSSELKAAKRGSREAELDSSRQLMVSLSDDAIPTGEVDDVVNGIDDLEDISRGAIDELEIMAQRAEQDGLAHVELRRALGIMDEIQGEKGVLGERTTEANETLGKQLKKGEALTARGEKKVEGGMLDEFAGKRTVDRGRGDKYAGAAQEKLGKEQFSKASRTETRGKDLIERGQKQIETGTAEYAAFKTSGSVGKSDGLNKIWQGYKNIDNGEAALVNSGKWRMRGNKNIYGGKKKVRTGDERISNGWIRESGSAKKISTGDSMVVGGRGTMLRGEYDFNRAMEPIEDSWAEYRAAFADSYSRIIVPKTPEEANTFTSRVSKLGGQLNDYVNRSRKLGKNPIDDEDFIRAAATYQAMITSARTSEWWLNGYDLDYLHSNFVSNASKVKDAAAKEKQWAITQRQLAAQEHTPFFSFQMPTYSYHPIRPAVAYLKHGPNGTFMQMLNSKTVDSAMRVWRSAVLFGLGTQMRIMSDEGGRLIDQGIGVNAMLGLGKHKIAKDLPYWVKSAEGYRSDIERYVPKMFDEMGGQTGRPYTANALNWMFSNISRGETGAVLNKWLAAKTPEEALKVLKNFAIANNFKTSFSSGLPKEIVRQNRGAYVRLQEMSGRVGVGANIKWAKEADNFFRNDLGLGRGDKIDGIMQRFLEASKAGKSGSLTKEEFNMLTQHGTNLPRIIAPSQFVSEYPNKVKTFLGGVESGVGTLFKPLEIMNTKVKGAFWREGFVRKYEALVEANAGKTLTEVDKQLMYESASRAGTRFMEENVYSGFKTALEYQYRNVMPFGSAYRDFLSYWLKAGLKRPTHAAYAVYLNDKLVENSDHELPVARALAQKIGFDILDNSIWSFKPSSMTFLTGGQGGFVPAVGPAVTVPLAFSRAKMEEMGFETDWIGEIPMFSFSSPDMAMFSKINKLVYGISGQFDHPVNLPFPLGQRSQDVDSKIDDAIDVEMYHWLKENKRVPSTAERAEIEQRAKDSVETDFLVEFLGQYVSPAGFSQTTGAENISRALTLYRNSPPSERQAMREFLTNGGQPPKSAEEFNAKPLDAEGAKILNDYVEMSKLPERRGPNAVTNTESLEDMLVGRPEMIPFFTGKTRRLVGGREPVTTEEKKGAYSKQLVRGDIEGLSPSTYLGKITEKTKHYIGKGKDSVSSQQAAFKGEKDFSAELANIKAGLGIPDGTSDEKVNEILDLVTYGNTGMSVKAYSDTFIHGKSGDYGKLSTLDKKTAATAMVHGGVNDLPNKDIPLLSAGVEYVGDKMNTATAKRLGQSMDHWGQGDFAAQGMDTAPEAIQPWVDIKLAEVTITGRMKSEQGPDVTFSSKAGKAYAAELDDFINALAEKNPAWAELYHAAKGPHWAQAQKLRYGLDDPASKDQWVKAYDILTSMTNQMADAKTTAAKNEAYRAAMAEIDKLKAENAAFAKQFSVLGKNATKPTASELRAWGGDYSKLGKAKGYSRKAKGVRRGRRGRAKGTSKKGGGVKAVKRSTVKSKKLRARR